jgi:death-on-curing protein
MDGNKRLGRLATAVFFELNGVRSLAASNDDVYELMMRVVAGDPPLEDIAAALRRLAGPPR